MSLLHFLKQQAHQLHHRYGAYASFGVRTILSVFVPGGEKIANLLSLSFEAVELIGGKAEANKRLEEEVDKLGQEIELLHKVLEQLEHRDMHRLLIQCCSMTASGSSFGRSPNQTQELVQQFTIRKLAEQNQSTLRRFQHDISQIRIEVGTLSSEVSSLYQEHTQLEEVVKHLTKLTLQLYQPEQYPLPHSHSIPVYQQLAMARLQAVQALQEKKPNHLLQVAHSVQPFADNSPVGGLMEMTAHAMQTPFHIERVLSPLEKGISKEIGLASELYKAFQADHRRIRFLQLRQQGESLLNTSPQQALAMFEQTQAEAPELVTESLEILIGEARKRTAPPATKRPKPKRPKPASPKTKATKSLASKPAAVKPPVGKEATAKSVSSPQSPPQYMTQLTSNVCTVCGETNIFNRTQCWNCSSSLLNKEIFNLSLINVVVQGEQIQPTLYRLNKHEVYLGRDPNCDISLPNNLIELRHARIVLEDRNYILSILNNSSRVLVNGNPIVHPEIVRSHDRIQIGDFTLRIIKTPADLQKLDIAGVVEPTLSRTPAPRTTSSFETPTPGSSLPSSSTEPAQPKDDSNTTKSKKSSDRARAQRPKFTEPPQVPTHPPASSSSSPLSRSPKLTPTQTRSHRVVLIEAGSKTTLFEFQKNQITIGKSEDNDIILAKGSVNLQHAQLMFRDKQYVLIDLGSTKGTYVNGAKVRAPKIVNHQDHIAIGRYEIRVIENRSELARFGLEASRG